jgi:hypothetical protein
MLVDVLLVLDQLVLHPLLQIGTLRTQLRQPIDDVDHQVEAVQVVLHSHIEGGGDRALLLLAADVQLHPIVAAVLTDRGQ